jgi:hypothetical protein
MPMIWIFLRTFPVQNQIEPPLYRKKKISQLLLLIPNQELLKPDGCSRAFGKLDWRLLL